MLPTANKLESFNRDSFYNSKEEFLNSVLSSNYTLTEDDVIILSEPMEKMCRCEDLMKWFGYGIYVFSMRHKDMCVSNSLTMDRDVIGNLRCIRLGLTNIHSVAHSLRESYPTCSQSIGKKLVQAVENRADIDYFKWEEEAPEELFHVCVHAPEGITIEYIDYGPPLEPHQEVRNITCPNFSIDSTVF